MTMMTDRQPPASSVSPGAGPSADEKKAALGFTIGGFLLWGPVGGIIAALAVGITQAFDNSPWDKPGGGPKLTDEQRAAQREQAIKEAEDWIARSRERAQQRGQEWADHRKQMRDWLSGGEQGDKPARPDRRSAADFAADTARASKNWYKLFDDRMAKGNVKVNDFYGATSDLFGNVANFVKDFWDGYTKERERQRQENQPEPATTEPAVISEPHQLNPETRPAVDPAPGVTTNNSVTPEPTPQPGPQPTPLPARPIPGPAGPRSELLEGVVMTADGTIVADGGEPAHRGPQGTTNLDLIHQAFTPVPKVLAGVSIQVDRLRHGQDLLQKRLTRLTSLAGYQGVPVAVFHMLAESRAAAAAVAKGLAGIELHNEMAKELADEALIGLQPADQDQAEVHAAGASGDQFDRAAA